jgi:DNA-binding NarL/FixJ family response regulator
MGMTKTDPSVIIADDHPLFRMALRLGVLDLAPLARVIETDCFDLLRRNMAVHPAADLVLLDLSMPGVEGLSSVQALRAQFPAMHIAVIAAVTQRSWVHSAQALGATAFIDKAITPELLRQVLQRLLDGGEWWPPEVSAPQRQHQPDEIGQRMERLSRQEVRILLYVREGRLNKQIAEALHISESTVKAHISSILGKLGLNSRTQAAVLAQRLLTAPA